MVAIIPFIGSICLGTVIGWLIRYFIRRFRSFTPKVFGALLTALFGGAVLRLFGADQNVLWCYPIGIFIGFFAYTIAGLIFVLKYPSSQSTPRRGFSPRGRSHHKLCDEGLAFHHPPEKGDSHYRPQKGDPDYAITHFT